MKNTYNYYTNIDIAKEISTKYNLNINAMYVSRTLTLYNKSS